MSEGFEYNINFPSLNYAGRPNGDFFTANEEPKPPVVMLFGWAGCQDKYLAKYAKMYEEIGVITVRYIAPPTLLFWKRSLMPQIGRKLVDLLFDLNFEMHPVFVHCFSNGGAFTYQYFSEALVKNSRELKVKGVVYDSGPGKRRLLSIYKAASAIVGGGKVYNFIVTFLITTYASVIWMYEIFAKHIFRIPSKDPYEMLIQEKQRWPQHFIYSQADDVIGFKDVEKFWRRRSELGVEVSHLCFEDSGHVKHLQVHRDAYSFSCASFVKKCLGLLHSDV